MARGPIIISSGSRNKLLRPYSFLPFIGSAWRGLLLSGPSESNGPYPLELDATLAMCLVLCSRTLDSFPRGRTCELQCGRERENEVRTRDGCVDKQRMVPRNFSQDQGTLLPYGYVLLGLQLVVRGVAAAAWRGLGRTIHSWRHFSRGARACAHQATMQSSKSTDQNEASMQYYVGIPSINIHCSRKITPLLSLN